jgi:hypothetical protein
MTDPLSLISLLSCKQNMVEGTRGGKAKAAPILMRIEQPAGPSTEIHL